MYTVNKLKNVTRVNKNNIDFLIQEQGKFYIQDTSNKYCSGDNFIETDSIRESIKNRLDDGELLVFIPNKALEGSSLEDVIFNENVEEYYHMCDALETAFKEGVIEKGNDGEIIFGRNDAFDEVIVYDYNDLSGDVQDIASSLFEDLFYGEDSDRIEMISNILDGMIEKTDDRFIDMLMDLKDVAETKECVLKDEYMADY